ncbi:MAG: SGNH/GDSL hydrolase family protein [Euzebya sp.]
MRFRRFVALGDSLTTGVGDYYPDGKLRGFADLLAHSVSVNNPPAVYANLARPSVRAAEVLADQVPAAVALCPDLISVVAGINDIIAVRYPVESIARVIQQIFAELHEQCPQATIVTALLPDLGHASLVARLLKGRVAALNDATNRAANRHGVIVIDLGQPHPLSRGELALDRIHPSALGHLRFARAYAEALGLPAPNPQYVGDRPRAESLRRAYRTAVVAPRFVTRRLARKTFIVQQPAKRGELSAL